MAENALAAERREGTGKGVARKLRAAGRIPAVLYGKGKASQSIAVNPRDLEKVLHGSGSGMNTLIALSLGGSKGHTVLVKELHRDPVRGHYLHADFYEVDLTRKIEVAVPIHFIGKAKGVEFGGLIDHPLREIEVECLPGDIPEYVEIDVSPLEIGDSLHVRDLTLPAGVELLTDPELGIANCMPPAVEEEAAAPVEGEALAEGVVAEGAEGEKAEGDRSADKEGGDS